MYGKRSRHFITQPNDFEYTRYTFCFNFGYTVLGEIWGIFAMADPDLQIRGGGGHPDAEIGAGGGGAVLKDIFSALRASI